MAQLAYKIYPIKFYREWLNLNTVKILFFKATVPLVKFAINDLKMTEKHQNNATLPIFSTRPYNTSEEGHHRRIKIEMFGIQKSAMTLLLIDFHFSPIYKTNSGGSWPFSFHFSDIHWSMNAMGLAQSKWHPKGITLTLHRTHTSMNVRKIKFISYIHTLFLHRFCSLGQKKHICVFQVSRLYLGFAPTLNILLWIVSKMSNLLENEEKCTEKCNFYIKYFDKIKCYADRPYLVFSELKPETHMFFFDLLMKFWCKSNKISGKEKLYTNMFYYDVQQSSPCSDINRTLPRPINSYIFPWHHLCDCRLSMYELC